MKNLCTLFLSISTIAIFAQTKSLGNSLKLTEGVASRVGMSEERLSRIDAMCKEAVGSQVPGIVALVARNGVIVFHKAYGTANAQTGEVLKKMPSLELHHKQRQLPLLLL